MTTHDLMRLGNVMLTILTVIVGVGLVGFIRYELVPAGSMPWYARLMFGTAVCCIYSVMLIALVMAWRTA